MDTYARYRPTTHDTAGLALPDRQHWLVAPVTRNRDDGEPLTESNWATFLTRLGGEGNTVEVHRFGHWACGWLEIILVDPADTERVKLAGDMANALSDYPVLDENDWSEREDAACALAWNQASIRDRLDYVKGLHGLDIHGGLSLRHPWGTFQDRTGFGDDQGSLRDRLLGH